MTTTDLLPITETVAPADLGQLRDEIRSLSADRTPIYPLGGQTSLDYGLTARREGVGLSLANLDRVVDYPVRDMTITVEPGLTMAALSEILAAERQQLPIDTPQSTFATIGGVVATDFAGPRRYRYGTMRDYVIGVTAIDARATEFKGGGRVVKNVAGYDFCKLLTGSLGTLGVITQLTLRVKPTPEASALAVCEVASADAAELVLAAMVNSDTQPVAIELVNGDCWSEEAVLSSGDDRGWGQLIVALEGTSAELDWAVQRLKQEWADVPADFVRIVDDESADALRDRLREFPAVEGSPLVVKASVLPSQVTAFVTACQRLDPNCNIQSHAGSGIVLARFSPTIGTDFGGVLVGQLQPEAQAAGGRVVVLHCDAPDLTRQAYWGGIDAAGRVMTAVKQKFDPYNLLNPRRFVYDIA